MGIIKSSTMALLTTLAALIIIVHCVEEDMENEYGRDLRPRFLDTGKSTYDEEWRAREESSVIQRPRRTDDLKEGLPDEPLKRRRKRKRRLQTAVVEELVPQAAMAYPGEPVRPYHDVDSETNLETTEKPKPRRRKFEQRPIRWIDEDVTPTERPHRRRVGIRRKRPSVSASPDLSELRQTADINSEVGDIKIDTQGGGHTDTDQEVNQETVYENTPDIVDEITPNRKLTDEATKISTDEIIDSRPAVLRPQISEDKSLSDFSMEIISNIATMNPKVKFPRRNKNKSSNVLEGRDKIEEPVDPQTLKDILRRSNGSSLSEILQKHNLSLTDLLHGKGDAVSIFKNNASTEDQKSSIDFKTATSEKEIESSTEVKAEVDEQVLINTESKYNTESVTENLITTEVAPMEIDNEKELEFTTTVKPAVESATRNRHRFPIGLRKKLRVRPQVTTSTTQKGQLSRDLVTINARRYSYLRRNITKSKEWKDVITNSKQNNIDDHNSTPELETTTAAITLEETTITNELESKKSYRDQIRPHANKDNKLDEINMDVTEATPSIPETTSDVHKCITDKPIVVTMTRPTAISLGLRQTALNNRLKRKRLKQKNSTTEPPQDDILKHLYGMGTLVSSSEFIAKTPQPQTTIDDIKDLETTLDDFMTTESITKMDEPVPTETMPTTVTTPKSIIKTTTDGSSKIEIEEILNDTQTLSKLSRVLMERNMTLEELVAHRERGSSHIHLADIFHDNSNESTPPEPFLTKSILEPMSKETYPLRALLDANSHEPNGKGITIDTMDEKPNKNITIPIAMDFGNNVNENAENMGIMSLFNNFTKSVTESILPPTSKETNENILEIVNLTSTNETGRKSRVLGDTEDDVVSWNEIFSLIGRPKNNETEDVKPETPHKKITIDDIDVDGLKVLEHLHRLKELDNHIVSSLEGNIQVNAFGNLEPERNSKGILDNIPSQTTSVTIATASIVGLGMVLFLLTYVAFKWKQQRTMTRKKPSFCEERISTPVFEHRKGHKNNSSTRSISPMIQTSNIYTVSTLDSNNGEESSEYMWDSLRKPFQ